MDSLEFKASLTVDDAGEITGTAWPFGTADRVGDVIEKGAFTTPARLPMLFAHSQEQAIGVWDSITENDTGLTVKGRLMVNDVARAREVRALVREGAVTGLSIGFVTRKAAGRPGGGRTIQALDLHEISIVPVPSHPGARIISAKAAGAAEIQEGHMAEETTETAPNAAAFAELRATIEQRYSDLETKSAGRADLDKMVERLNRIEATQNRPAVTTETKGEQSIEHKAFLSYVRSGVERMAADEAKSLTVSVDTAGGFTVPQGFVRELDRNLVEFSPMRSIARVSTTGVGEVLLPKRTAGPTASWVGETTARSSTQSAYGQQAITVYELACYVDVSNRLLEDSAFDLNSELAFDLGEEFGAAESAAFISGDGDTKPTGLLTNADVEQIETGTAGAVSLEELIGFFYQLPTAYARNASWIMNRATMGEIRALALASGMAGLWGENLASGTPATLMGRPVIEFPEMPVIAAGALPIAFGDFSKGFRIFDRTAVSILRDPFTMQTAGQVRFHARRRIGGEVTKAEALKFLKVKAAA